MYLTLIPLRHDTPLIAERHGDVLTLNGKIHDFSTLPEGGELSAETLGSPWIPEQVRRRDGVLHLVLLIPHGADAPAISRYPAPLTLEQDGPLDLPPYGATGTAN
ncbi:hypothetical protein [Puniceibacterium sediminis]|uniref:Uncharacterized protein n=1 Tax=Puniceibacterium sediminis TaxID=1608407 RepID=A0A238YNY3_9RHOB|nr:hypothetical protein [Puniceibacterium sediminis]SNR72374.1 hypothetical protein SAMN06265370_11849 [Puniceibacterium sediminis]